MVSRRFSAWQKLVALAPLLLLGVYLPGQMMMRCRIDGLLRVACCCSQKGDDDSGAQRSGPVAKAQDCCDHELLTSVRPVVDAACPSGAEVPLPTAALPVAAGSGAVATSARIARRWRTEGPPRNGPPIVLLKHAFLV